MNANETNNDQDAVAAWMSAGQPAMRSAGFSSTIIFLANSSRVSRSWLRSWSQSAGAIVIWTLRTRLVSKSSAALG